MAWPEHLFTDSTKIAQILAEHQVKKSTSTPKKDVTRHFLDGTKLKTKRKSGKRHNPNFDAMDTDENRTMVRHYLGEGHDVITWYNRYYVHFVNAEHRHIGTDLSFEDYVQKLKEAGITSPDQIGKTEGQFRLRRAYGDKSRFNKDNCRFEPITRMFEMTAPDGITKYRGSNVMEFAETHGLARYAVRQVLKGNAKQTLGWTGHYIDAE